ncbi:restriction endonuclease subunit S [Stomatobaculum longum]
MAERRVPRIRFKGFEEDWEQRKVSELADRYENLRVPVAEKLRVRGTTPYYGANGIQDYVRGFTHDGEFVLVAEDGANDLKNYPVQYVNGRIWVNNHAHVLQAKDKIADTRFLGYAVSRADIEAILVGGGRAKLNAEVLMRLALILPGRTEQIRLASFLVGIDSLLSLHQRKLEKLKILKKAMLEKMFPKNGAKVPEIRFSGFTEDWEQRKFSELVLIERGGSPRPIDNYITDAPDGLNWVKIGDAPAQGRYIFKTAEKIRPQGLSKTRQVQPGDLILSNSMSFGKPYIMGIHGCIHDGWLLIRDTGAKFDSKFLCHLLGSNQMLEQYRMFAAGSTVNNLNKELVGNTTVHIPVIQEQRVIGESLESIDKCISLHQRKLEKLRQIKKSMLERMFV